MIDIVEKAGETVDSHLGRAIFVRPSECSLDVAELTVQLVELGPSVGTIVSPVDILQHGAHRLAEVLETFRKVEILGVQIPRSRSHPNLWEPFGKPLSQHSSLPISLVQLSNDLCVQ